MSISHEILFGTLEGVKKLIQAGSNVNEKDVYGLTPLIEATLKEDINIAKLLLLLREKQIFVARLRLQMLK